jgi:phosphotransferase system  glucose/maltose/N-acetylglucosamine-specific IIC component
MRQNPLKQIDVIPVILLMLLFIVGIGITFFRNSGIHYDIGIALIVGLYPLYTGLKQIVAARKHEQDLSWYTQPSVLFGLAILLGALPWLLLQDFVNAAVPNAPLIRDIGGIVFTAVALGLVLAAVYFYFTQRTQGRRRQERMDEAAPLQRPARSGPQPKESREEE